jgi:hypothetical protein
MMEAVSTSERSVRLYGATFQKTTIFEVKMIVALPPFPHAHLWCGAQSQGQLYTFYPFETEDVAWKYGFASDLYLWCG